MGASVAYHLAKRGQRNILVVDSAESQGFGSTGAATGGFRVQFATEVNIRLSLLALRHLSALAEETGIDPEYRPYGYLFIAEREAEMAWLRQAVAIQKSAGVAAVREISADEVRELNPLVQSDQILGGSFSSIDGFMRPLKIMEACTVGAKKLGVEFEFETRVTGLKLDSDRITSVKTNKGPISADSVVNAAGAWAGQIASLCGFHLPVVPVPRQVAVTEVTDKLPANMPMTVFTRDGFHLRIRDGRVLLIWTTREIPPSSFDTTVNRPFLQQAYERAIENIPVLKEVRLDPEFSWAGLYEMSPDKTAILGKSPISNLYLINGSSGHGVMHSLALGDLLSQVMLGQEPSINIDALSLDRFAEGRMNPTSDIL
jgi:sarcosine oxidase subunit beta